MATSWNDFVDGVAQALNAARVGADRPHGALSTGSVPAVSAGPPGVAVGEAVDRPVGGRLCLVEDAPAGTQWPGRHGPPARLELGQSGGLLAIVRVGSGDSSSPRGPSGA